MTNKSLSKQMKQINVEIESSEDFNLDQPYIIDFNETGYFYANKKDRDEDFEKMRKYLAELENVMFN